nr:hypothetical protein [Bacteroidota bacterium]
MESENESESKDCLNFTFSTAKITLSFYPILSVNFW